MGYVAGDVHGDVEVLTRILFEAGIRDKAGKSITTEPIVFIGDFTDRGPTEWKCWSLWCHYSFSLLIYTMLPWVITMPSYLLMLL